ncbi:MAG: hypothetical protein ACI89L_000938 [Phycisphaerales bacterium]|jgi:hypothetical protein
MTQGAALGSGTKLGVRVRASAHKQRWRLPEAAKSCEIEMRLRVFGKKGLQILAIVSPIQ